MNYQRSHQGQNGTNGSVQAPHPVVYLASEEFAPRAEYYRGEDIEAMQHQLVGQAFIIDSMSFFELESGKRVWLLKPRGFDKPFKLSNSSGYKLGEAFGNNIQNDWPGKEVALTPNQYNTGWGVIVAPILRNSHAAPPAA